MIDPVTLYTYALSPYGMKVYWALIYKRIPFELVYVTPRTTPEIGFTSQQMVPVLQVGDQWRLESTDHCLWLNDLVPERPFAGQSDAERRQIVLGSEWVDRSLIALSFRRSIDPGLPWSGFRFGMKLAGVMRRTSGGVPFFVPLIWRHLLRRAPFVRREAAHLENCETFFAAQAHVIEELEERLAPTGWLAGTDRLSFADLAAWAQIVADFAFNFPKPLPIQTAPSVMAWMARIQAALPENPQPELVPNWRLPNFEK